MIHSTSKMGNWLAASIRVRYCICREQRHIDTEKSLYKLIIEQLPYVHLGWATDLEIFPQAVDGECIACGYAAVRDADQFRSRAHSIFRSTFTVIRDAGSDYYAGDCRDMAQTMEKILVADGTDGPRAYNRDTCAI